MGEPTSGTLDVEVCLVLSGASLGRELQVIPQWTPGSATGEIMFQHYNTGHNTSVCYVYAVAGDDYSPESGNYIFQPGMTRSCLDITIQSDSLYEVTENLFGEITGFLDPVGMNVDSLPGVTVSPDQTEIQIFDLDGEITLCNTNQCICVAIFDTVILLQSYRLDLNLSLTPSMSQMAHQPGQKWYV